MIALRSAIQVLIALLLVGGSACAAPVTGRDLAEICVKYEPRASYYILGAIDAFNVRIGQPQRFCIPRGSDIPSDHLTNTICRFVTVHPEQQVLRAGVWSFEHCGMLTRADLDGDRRLGSCEVPALRSGGVIETTSSLF